MKRVGRKKSAPPFVKRVGVRGRSTLRSPPSSFDVPPLLYTTPDTLSTDTRLTKNPFQSHLIGNISATATLNSSPQRHPLDHRSAVRASDQPYTDCPSFSTHSNVRLAFSLLSPFSVSLAEVATKKGCRQLRRQTTSHPSSPSSISKARN
jgi:hypothetical protein